jgi:hypothetical protein
MYCGSQSMFQITPKCHNQTAVNVRFWPFSKVRERPLL